VNLNRITCSVLLGALALLSVTHANAQKLIHSERSLYREVLVYEDGTERCMCFTQKCRIGRQTCLNTRAPNRFVMNYTQMMMTALFVNPEPRSILIIGLGGGTLPVALSRVLPNTKIDVVEIDPAVVRVARKFFGFTPDERTTVIEADGRVFVKRAVREKRQYDLVMLDAFDHEYIPEHLLTREFLQEVASLLTTQGVLAANTFSSSRLYDHESVTYAAVFGSFYNLRQDNRVILASKGPLPTMATIQRNAARFEKAYESFTIDVDRMVRMFSTNVDWNTQARVLTDQYSPANLLNLKE
jgi:spermidine synthase